MRCEVHQNYLSRYQTRSTNRYYCTHLCIYIQIFYCFYAHFFLLCCVVCNVYGKRAFYFSTLSIGLLFFLLFCLLRSEFFFSVTIFADLFCLHFYLSFLWNIFRWWRIITKNSLVFLFSFFVTINAAQDSSLARRIFFSVAGVAKTT